VLLTPPNIQNHVDEKSYRPAIRLKRIPLNEAEQFLPTSWIISNTRFFIIQKTTISLFLQLNQNEVEKNAQKN
jgi:hypothetical protein